MHFYSTQKIAQQTIESICFKQMFLGFEGAGVRIKNVIFQLGLHQPQVGLYWALK